MGRAELMAFRPTGKNFVRTMLALGRERDEVSVVDDQRGSPTYVGDLAIAVRELIDLPPGLWHLAAAGECTWAELAEAILRRPGSTAAYGASRLRSSGGLRRGPPTPCCEVNVHVRRCYRTGATGYALASTAWPSPPSRRTARA